MGNIGKYWITCIFMRLRMQYKYTHTCVFNSLFATFADLHVRKGATFANLQLYARLLFIHIVQWSDSHCFWFALCAYVINLAFWFSIQFTGKKIQRVENSTSKNGAPIPVRSKIMCHTGDLHVANKELSAFYCEEALHIVTLWILFTIMITRWAKTTPTFCTNELIRARMHCYLVYSFVTSLQYGFQKSFCEWLRVL